ncbi:hypothetical protein EBR96_00325, partial [bacterium]|nr:hypothetical protein [bacterium]
KPLPVSFYQIQLAAEHHFQIPIGDPIPDDKRQQVVAAFEHLAATAKFANPIGSSDPHHAIAPSVTPFSPMSPADALKAAQMQKMETAYKLYGGGSVVAFLNTVMRHSAVDVGSGNMFSVQEMANLLVAPEGKAFVTGHWRDTAGEKWGDQVRQGQHEWIPTHIVPELLASAIGTGDVATAQMVLAACDILRTPTEEVYLGPQVDAHTMADIGLDPSQYSASGIGEWQHHSGGMYGPRDVPHPKDDVKYHYEMYSKYSSKFHENLTQIVEDEIRNGLDVSRFLHRLLDQMNQELWDGQISGISQGDAQQIPSDLRGKARQGAELHGKLGLHSEIDSDGIGQRVVFSRPTTLADIQIAAHEAKLRNLDIARHRIAALLS